MTLGSINVKIKQMDECWISVLMRIWHQLYALLTRLIPLELQ